MTKKKTEGPGDLEKLIEDQLNLQVAIQFRRHHQFMLENGLKGCRNIIDLGTGNGAFLSALAKEHPDISFTGVDKNSNMIRRARNSTVDNVCWMIGDINEPKTIPELNEADGLLMRYLLLHLTDASAVFQTLHDILKDNARIWVIDLDLERYVCKPMHEAFELIKQLVRRYCDEHGKDCNIGSGLVDILHGAGFKSIKRETEPLNTDTVDISLLQKFIIQEVMAYRIALQNALTDEQFSKIKMFVDDIPKTGTFLNYGVSLVTAAK